MLNKQQMITGMAQFDAFRYVTNCQKLTSQTANNRHRFGSDLAHFSNVRGDESIDAGAVE